MCGVDAVVWLVGALGGLMYVGLHMHISQLRNSYSPNLVYVHIWARTCHIRTYVGTYVRTLVLCVST